jgi:hypothetical protein
MRHPAQHGYPIHELLELLASEGRAT